MSDEHIAQYLSVTKRRHSRRNIEFKKIKNVIENILVFLLFMGFVVQGVIFVDHQISIKVLNKRIFAHNCRYSSSLYFSLCSR